MMKLETWFFISRGFLRESFRRESHLVSLERELELVKCYLAIEAKRFEERMRVEYEIPNEIPKCRLPSFSLQPLVENAVHHGIGSRTEGGLITIRVTERDKRVQIEVVDNGPGIPGEVIAALATAESSGESIGLANVKARLEVHFGSDSEFFVKDSTIRFQVPSEGGENS